MNQLLKSLNDPVRRKILELLKEGDLTAGEIAMHFDISKASISHHLDQLKQASLVECTRKGQFQVYTLNMTVMDELLQWIVSLQKKK